MWPSLKGGNCERNSRENIIISIPGRMSSFTFLGNKFTGWGCALDSFLGSLRMLTAPEGLIINCNLHSWFSRILSLDSHRKYSWSSNKVSEHQEQFEGKEMQSEHVVAEWQGCDWAEETSAESWSAITWSLDDWTDENFMQIRRKRTERLGNIFVSADQLPDGHFSTGIGWSAAWWSLFDRYLVVSRLGENVSNR